MTTLEEEAQPVEDTEVQKVFRATRHITVPVFKDGEAVPGLYQRREAEITVKAWTSGLAKWKIDGVVADRHRKVWPARKAPWETRDIQWQEVPVPMGTPPYNLNYA